MRKIAILSAAIQAIDGVQYRHTITETEAIELLKGYDTFVSCIGHQGTADYIKLVFGIDIPVNRVQYRPEKGDIAIAVSAIERLPEGKVLNAKEMHGKFHLVFLEQIEIEAEMKQLHAVTINGMIYYDATKNAYKYQDATEQVFWVDGHVYTEAYRVMVRDFEDAGLAYQRAVVETNHAMLTAWTSDMSGVSKAKQLKPMPRFQVTVTANIEDLVQYGIQGYKLFYDPQSKSTYWLEVSESGIPIGGVSDFYDADGDPVSEWPVNGTELSAKFEIKEEE